ncbi:hypothetical protein JX266_007077 [Neoarthrinium moseri]|nr:hypothetical protein JX266_007077 [Neoarthrinium moseri]
MLIHSTAPSILATIEERNVLVVEIVQKSPSRFQINVVKRLVLPSQWIGGQEHEAWSSEAEHACREEVAATDIANFKILSVDVTSVLSSLSMAVTIFTILPSA